MRYYKVIEGDYITMIGTGFSGEEIDEAEYAEILEVLQNRPSRTETTDYRLKADLTWEAHQIEPDPDPEMDAEAAMEYLFGGVNA